MQKFLEHLKDKRVIGGIVALLVIVGIVFGVANRGVNVLRDKYFPVKFEGNNYSGDLTNESEYKLFKSIGDTLADKAKLTTSERSAIVGDGSDGMNIINGVNVSDYEVDNAFTLNDDQKKRLDQFDNWGREIHLSIKVNGKTDESDKGLKNGDKVTFIINVDKDATKKNPIRSAKRTVKVKGLKKVKTVKVSSLNKHLTLKATGLNIKSKKFIKLYKLVPDKYLKSQGVQESWLPSVHGNYINGDTVTIKASRIAKNLNGRSDEISNRYVADENLTFKVKGLVDPKNVDISNIENLVKKQVDKDNKSDAINVSKTGDLKGIYVKSPYYEYDSDDVYDVYVVYNKASDDDNDDFASSSSDDDTLLGYEVDAELKGSKLKSQDKSVVQGTVSSDDLKDYYQLK